MLRSIWGPLVLSYVLLAASLVGALGSIQLVFAKREAEHVTAHFPCQGAIGGAPAGRIVSGGGLSSSEK